MSLEDKTKNIEVVESEHEQAYAKMDSLKPYFYKGARGMLSGIYQALGIIEEFPGDKEMITLVQETYTDFEKNYPNVTKKDVEKTPELKPLYETKPIRKELKHLLTEFIDNPNKKNKEKVQKNIKEILTLGQEYDDCFKSTLHKIKEFDKHYQAEVIDKRTGNPFYYK